MLDVMNWVTIWRIIYNSRALSLSVCGYSVAICGTDSSCAQMIAVCGMSIRQANNNNWSNKKGIIFEIDYRKRLNNGQTDDFWKVVVISLSGGGQTKATRWPARACKFVTANEQFSIMFFSDARAHGHTVGVFLMRFRYVLFNASSYIYIINV